MTLSTEQVMAIQRPSSKLLWYYLLQSCLALIFFPLVFIPLFFKYQTLKYRFDDQGISMSWGILFRREVYLTYRKIQDIHLTRNLIERWMDLGTLQIQTASGSSGAEMSIVGVVELEDVRDFIYARMKGQEESETVDDPKIAVLVEIRDTLAAINQRLA